MYAWAQIPPATQENISIHTERRQAERSHGGGWQAEQGQGYSPGCGHRGPTHLGLLLMQLYLDVGELGPEVFIGSLKGDNERLGLLALISPFLGHCSFLNGVCCSLIPLTWVLPCYCFLSWSAMFQHLLCGAPWQGLLSCCPGRPEKRQRLLQWPRRGLVLDSHPQPEGSHLHDLPSTLPMNFQRSFQRAGRITPVPCSPPSEDLGVCCSYPRGLFQPQLPVLLASSPPPHSGIL